MGERLERAQSKALLAGSLAATGATIAGPYGAAAGAITGLIVGDQTTVFPMDMVCIPAFQAYMIQGTPSLIIYIKEGEVLTQVQPTDAMEAEAELQVAPVPSKKRKPTKHQRAYKKAFKALAPDYKKANGQWKKDGFKRCVKAAHKKAKE